jgi:hypothetical protein
MSKPFNYNAEEEALGIKPENYATASLTNGRSARIASMTAESIPGIETKKTIINETNTALETSLGDTYKILKEIYKNFYEVYTRPPSSNSERKKKYARLQTLQKEFNDEYERINSILPYTGNDKIIRARIAEIRSYYIKKRKDIAIQLISMKQNVESPSKDPDLLLPEPLPSNNSSLTPLPVTPSASAAAPAPVPALAPPPPQPAPRAPPRQWPPPGPIRLPGRNTRKNIPLPKRQPIVVPPPSVPPVSSKLQNARTRARHFNSLNNSITKEASPTLANIKRSLRDASTNSNSNNSNSNNSNNTKPIKKALKLANALEGAVSSKPQTPQTPQQPVQYIKLVNGTTYKFIEITDDNKAKVQKLDRVTKTWGSIEDLPDEQVVGFTEVKCPPSQAGGKRTTRRRIVKHHRHRTARRKSGK